jgi:hypothetical protein
MIDAALGAKIAWGQFFRGLLADLLKAILRATIIKAIFTALGAAFGGPAGAAAGSQAGSVLSSGGFSGLGGVLDSIGQPAQFVSPGLGAGIGSAASFASAGMALPIGPEVSMPITILPRRDKTAEAIEMLEEIRVLVERRGYYLPATTVLA